jgi:methylitaconate Delta-isomerase
MTSRAKTVRCSIVRGGTSRGVLVWSDELDPDEPERTRQILTIFGSPDAHQVDGVGGASVQTSKLAILGRPTRLGADLDYTFAQIGITQATVDRTGTCGNLSAAAALYAAEEGIVAAADDGRQTRVVLHNTNTGELITAYINAKAEALVTGETSSVYLDYADMAGGGPAAVFPTGQRKQEIKLEDGTHIEVSLCNVGNAMVYVRAADLGLTGHESPAELDGDPDTVARIGEIRDAGARLLREAGVAGLDSPGTRLPLVSLLARPRPGEQDCDGEPVDITLRLHAVGRTHLAIAGSAAISVAAASSYTGSLASEIALRSVIDGRFRIGHPAGVMRVDVGRQSETQFERLAYERTARRILDGVAYV